MLFLHVGLHKTATTYFQTEIFPRWHGLNYIHNQKIESLLKVDSDAPSLISREGFSGGVIASCEEKLTHLYRLSKLFPGAEIMISLRDHSGYLNAIYSQYLRYGGKGSLDEFFNLESDSGVIRQNDLRFRNYIEGITEYWGKEPFVFMLSELKGAFPDLLKDMGVFLGIEPPSDDSFSKGHRNVSLGRLQAEALRKMNIAFKAPFHPDGSRRPYRVLRRIGMDPPELCRRWSSWNKGEPIIDSRFARQIDEFYSDDLRFVKQCIEQRRNMISAA